MKKTIYLLWVPLFICMAFIYKESSLTENISSKNTSTQNLIKNTSQLFPAPQNNRFLFGAMDNYKIQGNIYSNYIIVYPEINS